MCRFVLYLGPPLTLDQLVTRPAHSLIHQSFGAKLRREPLNGDGFGIGWTAADPKVSPARYRSTRPAWNDANLHDIARVCESEMILAHVRAASPGLPVSEWNCHPFTDERLVFAHNGAIGGFAGVKRALQQRLSDDAYDGILGSTDSEHAFALLRDAYRDAEPTVDALAEAVEGTLRVILELTTGNGRRSHLNLAVSDGRRAVVSRFSDADEKPSLFLNRGHRYVCDEGICRMLAPGPEGPAVLIASEPLSEDGGWEEVPPDHLVLVDETRSVRLQPIRP